MIQQGPLIDLFFGGDVRITKNVDHATSKIIITPKKIPEPETKDSTSHFYSNVYLLNLFMLFICMLIPRVRNFYEYKYNDNNAFPSTYCVLMNSVYFCLLSSAIEKHAHNKER